MTPLAISHLSLDRFPKTSDKTLKAWNAADEYLINHIQENFSFDKSTKALIINDQFGALNCSLSNLRSTCWSDSFLSRKAILQNLKNNNLPFNLTFFDPLANSLESNSTFDLVVLRIPKHNSLLEFQLNSIFRFINDKTIILAAGMTKEIHNSTIAIFEKVIGTTTTSLAKRKARLLFTKFEKSDIEINDTERDLKTYEVKQKKVISYALPGVFSRDSLDIGSRVFLKHLPNTLNNQKLIDLGCGSGILGTVAAKANPSLQITFCDESFLAIESAKITFEKNIGKHACFKLTDVLEGLDDKSYDHIICNPPFHQQNVQTLSIANKMFKQSAKKLMPEGELRVVANRHLKYRPMLNSYFKNVDVISKDAKFVVWLATHPRL
ncbi:MAG: methyltransferase [Kangiellaceae bacterium]